MYLRTLRNESHTHRFSITPEQPSGWEVREERDSAVLRRAHYDDWHRVERARRTFALEAFTLFRDGWTEA
jgi:hypothetical protein